MVYLMHGFIGSGKTTRALEIEKQHRAIRINTDDWITGLFGYDPPCEKFQNYLHSLIDLLEPMWTFIAQGGQDVILDYGFWTRESREEITAYLDEKDLEYQWVVTETDIEICRQRNRERNKRGGNPLNITDNTFDVLLKQWEPMESN